MSSWSKFLLTMTLIAMAVCAWMYWLATSANAWSIKEAHKLGNEALVRVGDWCSGTVIDMKQGIVVTAAHCVNTPQMMQVVNTKKETSDGTLVNVAVTVWYPVTLTIDTFTDEGLLYKRGIYKAYYAGQDEDGDVAILKIGNPRGLLAEAKMSTAPVRFGDLIYCIGNPLMTPSVVSMGYVNQPRVESPFTPGEFVILFDALMDHGSSGGGLYNDSGEMIGISNIIGPNGEGLANPVANVFALLRQLKITLGKSDKLASAK